MSLLLLFACTSADIEAPAPTPEPTQTALGSGDGELDTTSAQWSYILGKDERLDDPRDLGFDPLGNLWIANRKDDRTFIVSDPGSKEATSERRKDGYAEHFMEETAAFAFEDESGADNFGNEFGSCGESENTYNDTARPDRFMGPVLWSAELDIFAEQNPFGLGSHLDMLHESPLCVGLAWEHDNVYWVFDGYNDAIVRYDFETNHGIGQDDHSDGIVFRLSEPKVARVENAPGHMEIDRETGILYVADAGNGRVLWLDTASGEQGDKLRVTEEPISTFAEWDGVEWGELVTDLDQPGALALDREGNLYVGDFETGVLHAYALDGTELQSLDTGWGKGAVYGMEIGPDGALWVVNHAEPAVMRLGTGD
ncbi:hypothetical protein LBMAG42_45740 [Deltaproteobacteria bacterium]|nr:hypothetical protein LBMAG42_45740 [Deltaproteobacteria bacterium]